MNQPLVHTPHANKSSLNHSRWGLIPALAFAALVSGVLYFFIFVSSMELRFKHADTVFTVLVSVSFGLALGAVLWFYSLISDWGRLATVVGATVAAHLMGLFVERHLPVAMGEFADYPVLGSVEPMVLVTGSAVALILYIAVLALTQPRCAIRSIVLISIVCSLSAGATMAAVEAQQGKWFEILYGQQLGLFWQVALAFFLGIALAVKGLCFAPRAPVPQEQPDPSWKERLAAFPVFLSYSLGIAVLGLLSPLLRPDTPPQRADKLAMRLTIDAGDMEQRLVYRVDPLYPPTARQARIEGTVTFSAVIGTDGSVKQLVVDKGHPLLVPAALDAIKQWKYQPVASEGNPVEVLTTVSVIFQLNKQ